MDGQQVETGSEAVGDVYRDAIAHLEGLAASASDRIPDLVAETRGDPGEVFRTAEPSLDAIFALKLIQLVGNVKSGELLVGHGFYGEWDMVARLIYETLEDLQFLAIGERHCWTKQHDRYVEVFFADDFERDGSVVQRGVGPVRRAEIAEFLSRVAGDGGERDAVVRNIARLHSAAVHGRSTGIIRGFYEAPQRRFWTGGSRSETSMASERLSLRWTASQVTDVVAWHVVPRWWGQEHARKTACIALRLRTAILSRG